MEMKMERKQQNKNRIQYVSLNTSTTSTSFLLPPLELTKIHSAPCDRLFCYIYFKHFWVDFFFFTCPVGFSMAPGRTWSWDHQQPHTFISTQSHPPPHSAVADCSRVPNNQLNQPNDWLLPGLYFIVRFLQIVCLSDLLFLYNT